MQRNRRFWILGSTGIAALTMGGVLFAQAQQPGGQAREGAAAEGRQAAQAGQAKGQDSQILVAHGLAMAIEGSTLQSLAMQGGAGSSGMIGGGTATDPGRSIRLPTDPTSGRTTADPAVGNTGAGASGSGAGGTTSAGRVDVSTGTSTGGASARASGGEIAQGGGTGRMTASAGGRSDAELTRHAMRAFEASDRLLRQASQGGAGSSARFQTAAVRYAQALRSMNGPGMGSGASRTGAGASSLGTNSGTSTTGTDNASGAAGGRGTGVVTNNRGSGQGTEGRIGSSTGNAGSLPAGGVSTTTGSGSGSQTAAVAVINHAVKEALDSMQLKMLVQSMGSTEGAAARTLLAHAQQMDTESHEAIDRVMATLGTAGAGASRAPAAASDPARGTAGATGAGGQGGSVRLLAQHAREILASLDEMNGGRTGARRGEGDRPADGARPDRGNDDPQSKDQ